MYTPKKPCRAEIYINNTRKIHKDTPSFSSTLLDEIYRSIDGGAEKSEDFKEHRETPEKKQVGCRTKTHIVEDEDRPSLRRACLVEKWIQNEKNERAASKRIIPNPEMDNGGDLVFFSSTSSSNSDSSGALLSSDTEFYASQTEPKVSCFSTRPKPIRTRLPARESKRVDYPTFGEAKTKIRDDHEVIKYKSRALNLYSNLKKAKHPISPGGRLTSFIHSIFSNSNEKKTKNAGPGDKNIRDIKPTREAWSACSSAASFSRSCLSKHSPESRGRAHQMVRFHPASVIVDEGSRPCGEKYTTIGGKLEKSRRVEEEVKNERKAYFGNKKMDDFSEISKIDNRDYEDEINDDDDELSDSSSNLFELDHIVLFGNNIFCEELPVYETTRLDTNRVIASRLIQ